MALRDSSGEINLGAEAHSSGEINHGAEAHSSGEINLPSSQTMLVSHCRRKRCYGFAPSPQRVEVLLLLLSKLSHLDGTRGEWLKAEGELNPV